MEIPRQILVVLISDYYITLFHDHLYPFVHGLSVLQPWCHQTKFAQNWFQGWKILETSDKWYSHNCPTWSFMSHGGGGVYSYTYKYLGAVDSYEDNMTHKTIQKSPGHLWNWYYVESLHFARIEYSSTWY